MAATTEPASELRSEELTWRPLRVLCIYRLMLALVLLGGFAATELTGGLTSIDSPLFAIAIGLYMVFAALALLAAQRGQSNFQWTVRAELAVDVVLLSVLIHAAGGMDSGLGILMVVAVAGGSLLADLRTAAFFAALATIILFAERGLFPANPGDLQTSFRELGLLGIAMFVTALGGALLARRARDNAELAYRRGIDVANLEALNDHIVQRMETGVVALDAACRCRLVNEAGVALLGAGHHFDHRPLSEIAPRLAAAHQRWLRQGKPETAAIADASGGAEFVPRFRSLGNGGTLVFLENLTEKRAQVQQAKLASLGRLTASIAHEIRNPLAAMLQANQLLEEDKTLSDADRRLVTIIANQGQRLNKTVNNVLQLSRQEPAQRENLVLDAWLNAFRDDWREQQGAELAALAIEVDAEPVTVTFDRHHLEQILGNLLRNARDHGGDAETPPQVRVSARVVDRERAVLEVTDNGSGVIEGVRAHLFEPFVTGSKTGTGLGLYLSRELCEANQARIEADNSPAGGALFRITLMRARSSEAA